MLAPIAYLGPTQVARWRDIQRQAADKELRFAAESIARAIGVALDISVRELTTMANQIGASGSFDLELFRTLLHEHCTAVSSCLGVFVSRPDGYPLTGDPSHPVTGGVGDREYYQAMLHAQQTVLSDVEIGRFTKVPTLHVCAPIWSSSDAIVMGNQWSRAWQTT